MRTNNGRIDLTLEEMEKFDEVGDMMHDELKYMYKKEDELIEYVGYLLATPDVLEQLMGSPSQIHCITNLTTSLEHLYSKLLDCERFPYRPK